VIPEASILIPVYNGAQYLRECLESVFRGTGVLTCEIVVVDDGSTDETAIILKEFCTTYENLIVITQANMGIEAALNNGLRKCRADIILRMDADDEMLPHRIQRQIQILTESIELSWTSGAAYLMDSGGRTLAKSWAPNSKQILDSLESHNFIIHPTVAFRKSAVLAVGGYEKIKKFHEDIYLWKRLRNAGKQYFYSPEEMIRYRISASSIRLKNEQEAARKLCRVLVYSGARKEAVRQFRFLSVSYKIRILIMILFPTNYWRRKMLRGASS